MISEILIERKLPAVSNILFKKCLTLYNTHVKVFLVVEKRSTSFATKKEKILIDIKLVSMIHY